MKTLINSRQHPKKTSGGFTIIELMIATIIFSIVLLVILASFLQIGRMYYKGISYSNTQEAARRAAEDLSNDVRFAVLDSAFNPDPHNNPGGDVRYFCVGSHRYTYTLYEKVTLSDLNDPSSLAGIVQDRVSGCPPPSESGADRRQLLGPDMQVNRFDFKCADGRCTIGLHIIYYGADDQVFTSSEVPSNPLRAKDAYCSGGLVSSQFCAAVDINTTILIRT